jgi:hypothetical protein
MSFYINNNNTCRPGGISGSPLNGLCEKALIEVTKVFDACRRLSTETGIVLPLSNFDPPGPTLPLTYISTTVATDMPVTISNVVIDRIDQRPNFANVSATVTIPLVVTYRDANGIIGTARSTLVVDESVILFVPQPSVIPINVTAFVSFNSTIGSIDVEGVTATITGCLQIVLKVTAVVDILVPSYGYPFIPPCQQMEPQICPGVSDLPLFPTAISCNN